MLLAITPVVSEYILENNSAVLKVTLIKPRVNTNLFDVKLSVRSNDKGRV